MLNMLVWFGAFGSLEDENGHLASRYGGGHLRTWWLAFQEQRKTSWLWSVMNQLRSLMLMPWLKLLGRRHQVQRFKIVANMVRSFLAKAENYLQKLTFVHRHFLNVSLELVACIPLDDKVRQSVKETENRSRRVPSLSCGVGNRAH